MSDKALASLSGLVLGVMAVFVVGVAFHLVQCAVRDWKDRK